MNNLYYILQGIVIILTGVFNLLASIMNIRLGKQMSESVILPVVLAIGSVVVIGSGIYLVFLGAS